MMDIKAISRFQCLNNLSDPLHRHCCPSFLSLPQLITVISVIIMISFSLSAQSCTSKTQGSEPKKSCTHVETAKGRGEERSDLHCLGRVLHSSVLDRHQAHDPAMHVETGGVDSQEMIMV